MAETRSRPTALPVRIEGIPDSLKAEPRWVNWRYEQRCGETRWAKILCTPTGSHAKSNDPRTWTTFDQALRAYQTGRFDGVGFCLGDGWAGLDLDHCIYGYDPSTGGLGAITSRVADYLHVLDHVGAYWEVSPSGTGYKAIGLCPRIGGQIDFAKDPPAVTPWRGARFFTVTGHYQTLSDWMVDLTEVIGAWFPSPPQSAMADEDRPEWVREGDTRGTERITDGDVYRPLSDDEVVEHILASPQADKFIKLVRGDTSDYGDDHSRADQALVSVLAYWCQRDVDQIDRLFRQTRLMRPKWDVDSYRRATLAKAVLL